MAELVHNRVGAAFRLITSSSEISQNLKNGLVGSMKAEDFKAGDLEYASKFMASRASSPTATPAEKELFKQLQAFEANGGCSGSAIDIDSAVNAVDTAKAPVTAGPINTKASVSVSDAVNGIVDQTPVGKDEKGRKVSFAHEGTPQGDWVHALLTKLDPSARDQSLSDAVTAYQKKNNLNHLDGKAGPETLRALLNDKNIEPGAKMADLDTQKIFAHAATLYPEEIAKSDAKPKADPKATNQTIEDAKPKADRKPEPVVTKSTPEVLEPKSTPELLETKPTPEVLETKPTPVTGRPVQAATNTAELVANSDQDLRSKLTTLEQQWERLENARFQFPPTAAFEKLRAQAKPYMEEAFRRQLLDFKKEPDNYFITNFGNYGDQ